VTQKPPKTPAEFLAILKQGREVWNDWRKDNPDVVPDFSGVDFTNAKEFAGTPIWGRAPHWLILDPEKETILLDGFNLKNVNIEHACLNRALLAAANLRGANLNFCDLHNADLFLADMEGAYLSKASLRYTNFLLSSLKSAHLYEASLDNADLSHADLSGADMSGTSIVGADMRGANLQGAKVMGIKYDRRRMHGKYLGINAAECYGDADFRRDAMDQDYIDKKHQEWRDPFRSLLLLLWASVDYGRSMLGVLVWSCALIFFFGSLYAAWAPIAGGVCPTDAMARPGAHVEYIGAGASANIGVCNGFTPYYAAAVSFSTLGFTDVIRPTSFLGQAALMFNVLAGYFVLGLLLAILANTIARRA
jgi:uncharacterized protein YjbI with pentapeptide repeats